MINNHYLPLFLVQVKEAAVHPPYALFPGQLTEVGIVLIYENAVAHWAD